MRKPARPAGSVEFLDDLVHKFNVMQAGVLDANALTPSFFSGRTGMMLLSTGSISFVRENMKRPYRAAFLPRRIANAPGSAGRR